MWEGVETGFSTFLAMLSSILRSSGAILSSVTVNMQGEISMVNKPQLSSLLSFLILSVRFTAVRMVCHMPYGGLVPLSHFILTRVSLASLYTHRGHIANPNPNPNPTS